MANQDAHSGVVARDDAQPAAIPDDVSRLPDERTDRRLAAIAFLDVVGSTRLMEYDEDATLRHWVALRRQVIEPRVHVWCGRVVNLTGDGLLAEFRSVFDAVRWALDVQAVLALFAAREPFVRMRIAIHLGDVVETVDGHIYGHAVNIAARLQEHATPGGIAVSQAVHEQVRHRFEHEMKDVGLLSLKNIAQPVRVFRLAPTSPRSRDPVVVVGDVAGPVAAPAAQRLTPRISAPTLGVLVSAAHPILSFASRLSKVRTSLFVVLRTTTALPTHLISPAARRGWRATKACAAARLGEARRLGLALLQSGGER